MKGHGGWFGVLRRCGCCFCYCCGVRKLYDLQRCLSVAPRTSHRNARSSRTRPRLKLIQDSLVRALAPVHHGQRQRQLVPARRRCSCCRCERCLSDRRRGNSGVDRIVVDVNIKADTSIGVPELIEATARQ